MPDMVLIRVQGNLDTMHVSVELDTEALAWRSVSVALDTCIVELWTES